MGVLPTYVSCLENKKFLLDNVSMLFLNNNLSDISLLAINENGGHRTLPAHKIILGACSPFWRKILSNTANGNEKAIVKLEGVSGDILEETLRFIYCGRVCLTSENIVEVIIAAKKFRLDALLETCKIYVVENKALDLCCKILDMSCSDSDLDGLKAACKAYVLENSDRFVDFPELIHNMNQTTLVLLMQSDELRLDELEVFRLVQGWCALHATDKNDIEEMKRLFSPFELLIRYPLMLPHQLQNVVRASGLVQEQVLLDAWEMTRGLGLERHRAWIKPRFSYLSTKISWNLVGVFLAFAAIFDIA